MHEAMFYKKTDGLTVECLLCRHCCRIKDGHRGICMVRENRGGTLYSVFYGRPCAMAVDPIEKKPLFHFYPGSTSFSVATPGCNFQCEFCQNWDISQYGRAAGVADFGLRQEVSPQAIVDKALEYGCRTVSYTYSEPTIFFEYARDTALLAKPRGVENVFVTNGYMSHKALADAKGWLTAANVDLKAFRKETYRKVMKADLNGVLDTIREMKHLGIWLEITTLIVPKMNDDRGELAEIAGFIAGVGKEIPWHISRFHPQYKMQDRPPTPAGTIDAAYEIGKKAGLRYVYTGNLADNARENTYCWKCSELLIERMGFAVLNDRIKGTGICPKCSVKIDGMF